MVKSKLRFDSLKVSVEGNRSRVSMIVLKQIENVLVRFPCFLTLDRTVARSLIIGRSNIWRMKVEWI